MIGFMSFLKHILPYLGMADYIFLLVIVFFIVLTIISFFYTDGAFGPVIFIGAIIVGIMYYVNHIPYGVYQAKNIEKNGKVIGENTKQGSSYSIDIDKEYIRQGSASFRFLYCENKSNFYVDVYCYDDMRIIVTKMGTVKSILGNNKTTQSVYTKDINY